MTNPTRFGQPVDPTLVADVLTAVSATRDRLREVRRSSGTTLEETHRTLRVLAGADDALSGLAHPELDLADLIHALVRDYADALTHLQAFAIEPTDPTAEYERLIRAAEKELGPYSTRSDAAARAEALIKIADRWLSDAIVQAHKRRTAAGGSVTHFGSPAEQVVNQHELRERGAVTFNSADAATEYFASYGSEAIAIVDVHGAVYLLSEHEDTGTFYVGIPQAEDEDGIDVDQNRGRLRTDAEGKGHPAYPLTILSNGAGASYPRAAEDS